MKNNRRHDLIELCPPLLRTQQRVMIGQGSKAKDQHNVPNSCGTLCSPRILPQRRPLLVTLGIAHVIPDDFTQMNY